MMGPWYSCQMRPGECGMVSCFPQSHWNIITPFRFSTLPCYAWDTGIFLGQSRIRAVPVIFQVSRSLLCTSVASQEAQAVALSSVALTHSPGSPFGEGNGTPLQYSCLENPRDRGAWWAAVHGVTKSRTRLHFHFHFSLSCTGEGNGNPLQCSCLENPRDGGAWWAAISGVAQSRTWWNRLSSSSSRAIDVGKDWRQKEKRAVRRRWLDIITNSIDMSLNKFWETVKDREAWSASVHGGTKSQIQLSD